jgi:hypothetical protein
VTDTNYEEIEVETLNDAEIVGVVDKSVWDREVSMLYSPNGARLSRDRWIPRTTTFGNLFASTLSHHKVGPKDGPCIVLGHGSERSKKAMHYASMVGIDVDNGQNPQDIEDALLDNNVCGLIYTTHSHLANYSDAEQDAVIKFCDLDEDDAVPSREMLVLYWVEKKGIDKSVFEGDFPEPEFVHTDKPAWRLYHNPLPKFRVFIPLAEDFPFSLPSEPHKRRLERFADKLRGLAQMLGIERMDESCTDPSRLFYLPSHAEGSAFSIILVAGELLDFNSVPEIKSTRKGLAALKELGSHLAGASRQIEGMSLKKWASIYADGFEILDAVRDHVPDKVRGSCSSNQGMEIECPFDEDHSNAGDPEDRAFMVINGSESDQGGFIATCRHDSCREHDRLDFLAKMLDDEWFPESVLTDENYVFIVAEDDEECEEKAKKALVLFEKTDIKRAIDGLKAGEIADAEEIISAICKTRYSTLERSELMKTMAKRLGLSRADMDKNYKETRQRLALEEADKLSEEYEKRAEMGVIYIDKTSFDTQVRLAWSKLLRKQRDNPQMFWSDQGEIVRLKTMLSGKTKRSVGTNDLLDAVAHSCHWKTLTMEGDQTAAPPDAVIRTMLASDNARNRLPILHEIVSTPFYTDDGDLVMEPGYNESGYYLDDPDAGSYPDIPVNPTDEEVFEALDFIMDNVFVDFPFDDNTEGESSRCHALAMLLQPFVRPMIHGPTPIYFVDKPLPGTGATLLINAILRISSGREPQAQTLPDSEEEFRKTITASLSEGARYFWLDNVDRTIDSQSFASVVTSQFWKDRRLGQSSSIEFPIRNQFIVCGNNVDMRSEMIRRMLLIHLDPKTSDPTARTGFKHTHLLEWVARNRTRLVHACLILCQAWISDGCPKSTKTKASYEDYAAVMGGIMESIGVDGFMENESMLKLSSDSESGPMDEFIYLWWDLFGDEWLKIGGGEGAGAEGLFAVIAEQQVPFVVANNEQTLKIKLGRKLKMLSNRQFRIDVDEEEIEVRVEIKPRQNRVNEYRLNVISRTPKVLDN